MSPLPESTTSGQTTADSANSTSLLSSRLTSIEASSILSDLASASLRGDLSRCRKSITRVRDLATGSQRNRRCLANSGAASVLAALFRAFSDAGSASDILSEILSSLILVFHADDKEIFYHLRSPKSLNAIVSILISGDSSRKLNAVLVLKEIVSFDRDFSRAAAMIDGLLEVLVSMISDPISPRNKKAAQFVTFHLVSSSEDWMAARLVRSGVVSLVLESLVDSESERRVSEAALSALDRLCDYEIGRKKAYGNALTIPVIVKKMFGISDLSTDLAVSSLWKLCKNWEIMMEEEGIQGEGCVIEALQFGAFLKLLMLIQLECREGVKEKATELLRLLYGYRTVLGCIDSNDFAGLQRPA